MNDKELIERYIPMMKFIASIVGKHSEVVLHDLSGEDNSIIAIENGQLSGRKVGDAPTNLILQVRQDQTYLKQPFIGNYKAYGKNGKLFRSWSYFIKNPNNDLIGVLCVNSDVEHFVKIREMMDGFLNFDETTAEADPSTSKEASYISEQLHGQADDVLASIIEQTMQSVKVPGDRMSLQEKLDLVKHLYHQGAFQLKGGVHLVAKHLKTSEPTIYRYIQKIKEE
ncbi:PAS domain-containing protein [Paenibacillus sp. N1-5-1-14]|uniref:helix-turn-helix transcriptional regulator n=1 Tax=Paenibacillus radicibacter TaxID=2972488 RepID=UPI002159B164|nr:PAS domain-containing protein [Paenibacillus radicibacter]MCR8644868.1 PAS domain-containing protein [Paenibacillus radicibacter]